MKLYYSPGACSLSPHIALFEAGLKFDIERVNLANKQTAGGADFRAINPKGYVPALGLDNGELLTEGPAMVQYIADQVPEKKLAPAAGTMERYRLTEWLNFISTEIHKGFSPLFKPHMPDEAKKMARELLALRFEFIAQQLEGKQYLTGAQFTVADGYLFTTMNWAPRVDVDLSRWPVLQAFQERVAARPAVQQALAAEGLLKH
jgi:glutathione S-transferase